MTEDEDDRPLHVVKGHNKILLEHNARMRAQLACIRMEAATGEWGSKEKREAIIALTGENPYGRINYEVAKLDIEFHQGHSIIWNAQRDKYDNPVSIITINGDDAVKFRMVLHSKNSAAAHQKYSIYAGRGKFVRVHTFAPSNDCMATYIEIAGFKVSWGDGDNLGVEKAPGVPNLLPELEVTLGTIQGDDFAKVILTVISAIMPFDDFWEHKEVAVTPPVSQTQTGD